MVGLVCLVYFTRWCQLYPDLRSILDILATVSGKLETISKVAATAAVSRHCQLPCSFAQMSTQFSSYASPVLCLQLTCQEVGKLRVVYLGLQ